MSTMERVVPLKRMTQFREFGVLVVLISICALLSLFSPAFLRPTNLLNIVRQTTEISIMAIGMTFVIVNAEIDLSVGSIYGLCSMVAAIMIADGLPPTFAFIVAMCAGAFTGLINGFFSTVGRLPALIVTLGTMQILRSLAFGINNGMNVSEFPDASLRSWFFGMGGNVGAVPIQVIIMVALYVVAGLVMSRTSSASKSMPRGETRTPQD